MYYVSPKNNYLHVEHAETKEEKKESLFVLPEDFKESLKPYQIMKVIEDSNNIYFKGSLIVVPTNMIEEITLKEQTILLVQHNYILALLTKQE
jgi:hypothetical protein